MTVLLVVGAGAMGAWTAYWAARGGLDTRLVDAFGPGDPRATSGDESRIIRSSHGPDEFYALWARDARELWIDPTLANPAATNIESAPRADAAPQPASAPSSQNLSPVGARPQVLGEF